MCLALTIWGVRVAVQVGLVVGLGISVAYGIRLRQRLGRDLHVGNSDLTGNAQALLLVSYQVLICSSVSETQGLKSAEEKSR